MAQRFGLDWEAIDRSINRLDEYQRPLEITDPVHNPEPLQQFEPFEFQLPTLEELETIDPNTEEGRRRIVDPTLFETQDEYEYYILNEAAVGDIVRRIEREAEEEPLPPYEEPDPPPEYELPPNYTMRRGYRLEQDLYNSWWGRFELPPIPEETVRFMRYDPPPIPMPTPNPTTIGPTEVPILPPNTPETGEVQLQLDGTFTLTGSGAWAVAADISIRLFIQLATCKPIDLHSWRLVPRATSFFAETAD